MRPVRPGDRGPAVEDIQRRLLRLGFDLGPSGVDGVFAGATEDAVRSFQSAHGLDEDGFVGDRTWASLVDATFTLGDRMLYLRVPHLHGHDVLVLQSALSALGFSPGLCDGIFGALTAGAVKEFQRNVAHPADGIVGPDTVGAIAGLRHVWEGKSGSPYPPRARGTDRMAEVLSKVAIGVVATDEGASDIAARLVNLAHATTPAARTVLHVRSDATDEPVALLLAAGGTPHAPAGVPFVSLSHDASAMTQRLVTAFVAAGGESRRSVVIGLGDAGEMGERERQGTAVLLLDTVCAALE